MKENLYAFTVLQLALDLNDPQTHAVEVSNSVIPTVS